MINLQQRIQHHIESSQKSVFSRDAFEQFGGYDQVGRALRKLCASGILCKPAKGIYAKTATPKETLALEIPALLQDTLRNPNRSRRLPTLIHGKPDNAPASPGTTPTAPLRNGRLTAKGVKRPARTTSLSQRLDMSFPYDWSNTRMDEKVFSVRVLERGYFRDMLKLAKHIGIERLNRITQDNLSRLPLRTQQKISNITKGAQTRHV